MKKFLKLAIAMAVSGTICTAQADVFSDMEKKNVSSYNALLKGKTTEEKLELEHAAAVHEDPEIRALPYDRATRNYASEDSELKFFTEQLQKEQDSKVLAAGLRSLMNNLKVSPALYELYKKSATHADSSVRSAAMMGLINTNNSSVAGIESEAIKFLDDKDPKIAMSACKELGRAKNAAAIDRVEAMLKSYDPAQAKLLGSCAEGLLYMWYDAPFFKSFDARAYKMTLDYLKLPRSKDMPAWSVISNLKKAPKPEWFKLSDGAYKPADVVAVLADIAKDKQAPKMAREYSVEAIGIHGTKADLEALAKELADDPVAKKIEKAMKTAK